jgi:hypothetical protein
VLESLLKLLRGFLIVLPYLAAIDYDVAVVEVGIEPEIVFLLRETLIKLSLSTELLG